MRTSFAAVLMGCLSVSCGGGSGSTGPTGMVSAADSCGKVTACGGDVVGTWTGVAECSTDPAVVSDGQCTQTFTESTPNPSFNAVFGTDGSYSIASGGYTQRFAFNASAACLTENGMAETCTDLGTGLMATAFATASCAADKTGGCDCAATGDAPQSSDTGTYAIFDSALVLTSASDVAEPTATTYCVQGSTLHIVISPMEAGQEEQDLVLVKQ